MLSQHIKGRRPINLEAALAYAKGFECSLDDISPRLAEEIKQASSLKQKNAPNSSNGLAEWRLKASTRSIQVLDQLTLLAQQFALQDQDWLLLQTTAQHLASKAQAEADLQDLPLQVTAQAQDTVDKRVRKAQQQREQTPQQGHQPAKKRAA